MRIRSLQLKNFRNLDDGQTQFENGCNWVYGSNGQGKTNLLEAIYFVLTSKSFRTNRLADLLRHEEKSCEVAAELFKGEHITRFGVAVRDGKTSRYLGQSPCRPMDFFKAGAVMAFTARSKNLVEGNPDDRRRFIDRMISYLDPSHIVDLSRYRKVQSQLKGILHKSRDLAVFRSFKQTLIPIALKITKKRMLFLDELKEDASQIYREIFGGDELYFEYKIKNCQNIDKYDQLMFDYCAQEVLYGKFMMGPHIDDLDVRFTTGKARRFASSGQVRAIVLSFKLAVRQAYRNRFGFSPVFLLDELDAELDPVRFTRVSTHLEGHGQSLITTSKYGTIEECKGITVFKVDTGRISVERKGE